MAQKRSSELEQEVERLKAALALSASKAEPAAPTFVKGEGKLLQGEEYVLQTEHTLRWAPQAIYFVLRSAKETLSLQMERATSLPPPPKVLKSFLAVLGFWGEVYQSHLCERRFLEFSSGIPYAQWDRVVARLREDLQSRPSAGGAGGAGEECQVCAPGA